MESFISNTTKREIITTLLEPNYKNEIRTNLYLKKKFKNYGLLFESTSKFFVGLSSIVSFAGVIYKYQILSFLAGTSSVVSLVLLQYAAYSYRESKKLTNSTQDLLKKINITFPTENGSNVSENGSLEELSPKIKP
jgi:hypothetical protein